MSLYGFHLVIRKKGIQHPTVFHFFVPKKNFKSKEAMESWVSTMNGQARKLQQKHRRKRKKRPNFWCSGEYAPLPSGKVTNLATGKGISKVRPKHRREEGRTPQLQCEEHLTFVPTISEIQVLVPPHQEAQGAGYLTKNLSLSPIRGEGFLLHKK